MLDKTLVREMFQAGMSWTEIKNTLVEQDASFTSISIAKLREICNQDIKAREKNAESNLSAPENYESISVLGRQVKIRKRAYKDNGMPPEVQDKIQQNQLLASEACATCGFKPGPGRFCTMPCGMCQMGHITHLDFDPQKLIEENQQLKAQYKKLATDDKPAKSEERTIKNVFDDDVKAQKKATTVASVNGSPEDIATLEADVSQAETELDPGHIIDVALSEAKETADSKIEDIDNFNVDIEIDDKELEDAEFEIPKDLDVDGEEPTIHDVDDVLDDD